MWHNSVYSLLINQIVKKKDIGDDQDSHEMLYAFDGSELDRSMIIQMVKLRKKG